MKITSRLLCPAGRHITPRGSVNRV